MKLEDNMQEHVQLLHAHKADADSKGDCSHEKESLASLAADCPKNLRSGFLEAVCRYGLHFFVLEIVCF